VTRPSVLGINNVIYKLISMQYRQLGPFSVSAISLGCMNLSHAYGAPVSAEQGERVLLAALDALINEKTVAGNRYNDQANREVDTEAF